MNSSGQRGTGLFTRVRRPNLERGKEGLAERARALEAGATPAQRVTAARADYAELTAPVHIPESSAADPARVAILVAHGMGQQVKFETLELVVNSLRLGAGLVSLRSASDVEVEQVAFGEDFFARAAMRLSADKKERHVHLYEAYWAPLTEGRITTVETFWFLVQAGILGLRRAWRRRMGRLMFDDWQEFSGRWTTVFGFALAVKTLLALFVMNAVVVAAVASRGIGSPGGHWPAGPLLADLTVDFGLVVSVAIACVLLGVVLPRALRRKQKGGRRTAAPHWISVMGNWSMRLAIVWIILMAWLIAYHLVRHEGPHTGPMWKHSAFDLLVTPLAASSQRAPTWEITALTLFLWGMVALIGMRVRHFLLQFVGDVAIYVGAHSVNRFYDVRQAIQAAVRKVTRCVYGLRDAQGRLAYDRIIVVGHSLGSVIAYDALDEVVREHPDPLGDEGPVTRTSALITFGSPLDKTAFVFRTQQSEASQVREALAASVQPLIVDYRYRPAQWINLWTRFDWVCGDLNYYDRDAAHNDRTNPKRVQNKEDPQASTPLQAHTEYWENDLLANQLWEEVFR